MTMHIDAAAPACICCGTAPAADQCAYCGPCWVALHCVCDRPDMCEMNHTPDHTEDPYFAAAKAARGL